MNKVLYFYLLLFFLIVSCVNSSRSIKSLEIDYLNIDSIKLVPFANSGDGFIYLNQNYIYFFDKLFLTITKFDHQGVLLETYLGKGPEAFEIKDFLYAGFIGEENLIFLDRSYNLYRYNNFIKNDSSKLDWGRKKNQYAEQDYKEIATYSFNYFNNPYSSNVLTIIEDSLFVPLWISPSINPFLNGYVNVEKYYNKSAAIGVVDIKSGKVVQIIGNKKQFGRSHYNIPNFDFLSIATDPKKQLIYVSKALDPYIQVYKKNNFSLVKQFGVSGENMSNNFKQTFTPSESEENFRQSYYEQGYYYNIYVSDNMVFRSYTKNRELGGLQIYRTDTLIGDVPVQKRFNIIGKIADWYYADGNITEDEIFIYKFKIKL